MNLSNVVESESQLRSVFSWNTRIGIAPKFGTCSIHHYQLEQFEAIGAIERLARAKDISLLNIRFKRGSIDRVGFLSGVNTKTGKRMDFALVSFGKVTSL